MHFTLRIFNQFLLFSILLIKSASAFSPKSLAVGLGVYSENALYQTSSKETGETAALGTSNYPLNLKYDMTLIGSWFYSPQISYTLIPRASTGDTAKITIAHLSLLFGKNLFNTTRGADNWDWFTGPGLIQYQIKGAGGTKVMNNGTSTATFAVPGNSTTVQKITLNAGFSYTNFPSRFGFEIIFENFFNSTKRTQSVMLSYSYLFSQSGRGR